MSENTDNLIKAFKNGKRGKFRRIDGGKLKFIRSHDGKVEKDTTSVAGMNVQFGSPTDAVMATGNLSKPKKNPNCTCNLEKCSCKLKKADKECSECHGMGTNEAGDGPCEMCGGVEKAATCDCDHEGAVCKEVTDCSCECEDEDTCTKRLTDDLDKVLKTLKAKTGPSETPCPTCGK